MTIDWLLVIFGLGFGFAVGFVCGYPLYGRPVKKVEPLAERLGDSQRLIGECLSSAARIDLHAKREAMLAAYAKNSQPLIVWRPNRAWRKWSKPGRTRISSRP